MNWENARNSAQLLAERLRKFEERGPAQPRFGDLHLRDEPDLATQHRYETPLQPAESRCDIGMDLRPLPAVQTPADFMRDSSAPDDHERAPPPIRSESWDNDPWRYRPHDEQHDESAPSEDQESLSTASVEGQGEQPAVTAPEPDFTLPPGDAVQAEAAVPYVEDPHDLGNEPPALVPRGAPRKNHTLPAYLTAPGMSNVVPARVIDMSATGAKIELMPLGRSSGIPMGDLPDNFILVLRVDRMEVDCELIWQNDWMIGARFLGVPRPTPDRR